MSQHNTNSREAPLPKDLNVFLTVIRKQSFAAAAEELGQSPAYISKRIRILEDSLKTRLLHRTTRNIALTEDGERMQQWATRILADIDDMMDDLTQTRHIPRGLLHICSTFGFGRRHVAPAVSRLSEEFPDLEIRLEVFDRAVDIIHDGFDLEIRIGDDLPQQHICKLLRENERILCSSPVYLDRHGVPETIEDLQDHNCLVLKERNSPFGIWHLNRDGQELTVTVRGSLSTNNGEVVSQWARDGRGIVLRSTWELEPLLKSGELVRVLEEYSQPANIWAVYPTRLSRSAKLRVCVEFFERYFQFDSR